jgi:hypothetical protein
MRAAGCVCLPSPRFALSPKPLHRQPTIILKSIVLTQMDASTSLGSEADLCSRPSHTSDTGFDAAWSSSDASTLNPSRPVKLRRAWERKPKSPFAQRRGSRKVWRRYSVRPRHTSHHDDPWLSPSLQQQSPRKITKKLCLTHGYEQPHGAPMRLEREAITLTRKYS